MLAKWTQTFFVVVLLSLAWTSPSQAAVYGSPAQAEGQGVINELDFEKYTVLIGGIQYDVSQTVHVEIGGSYGAFTLLKEGMKIRFNYLQYPDGRTEVLQMYEDNNIEES